MVYVSSFTIWKSIRENHSLIRVTPGKEKVSEKTKGPRDCGAFLKTFMKHFHATIKTILLLIFIMGSFCFTDHLQKKKSAAVTRFVSEKITLKKGLSFYLNVPEGYHIHVAYEGLKRLRFLTRSPDGRLFATDMYDLTDNNSSKIYIFDDWDAKTRSFRKIHTYLEDLHNVTQVAFYNKDGKDYIYIPETEKITRYEYHAGDNAPSGKPTLIASFPSYGLSYKYGGWHLTRSLAFHRNKLYVSIGTSCNTCVEKENIRASIWEMDPEGENQQIFAGGLRNSVGIKWIGNELWATCMERDELGNEMPEDMFNHIRKNKFYGWPYYYQYQNKVYANKQLQDSARQQGHNIPSAPSLAYCGFKAHSAPLGFDYFKGFDDPLLKNSFLIALHGSTDVSLQKGNAVVKITGRGKYTTIVDGFLTGPKPGNRMGRPCDVMMNDGHSFFITDDMNGVLYYVEKQP